MTDYKTIAESNRFIVLDKYTREWQVSEAYQSEGELERELIEDLKNQREMELIFPMIATRMGH